MSRVEKEGEEYVWAKNKDYSRPIRFGYKYGKTHSLEPEETGLIPAVFIDEYDYRKVEEVDNPNRSESGELSEYDHVPTSDDTVDYIQGWLDKKSVDYKSSMKKDELLSVVDDNES